MTQVVITYQLPQDQADLEGAIAGRQAMEALAALEQWLRVRQANIVAMPRRPEDDDTIAAERRGYARAIQNALRQLERLTLPSAADAAPQAPDDDDEDDLDR